MNSGFLVRNLPDMRYECSIRLSGPIRLLPARRFQKLAHYWATDYDWRKAFGPAQPGPLLLRLHVHRLEVELADVGQRNLLGSRNS